MHSNGIQKLSFEQLDTEQQANCIRQKNIDLADRSLPGAFMYLVIWFFLFYLIYPTNGNTDTIAETLDWLTVISVAIAGAGIIRFCLNWQVKKHLDQPNICQYLLISGISISSLTWGVMAACASLETPLAPHSQIILLTTCGLSAGGGISFSPSRLLTLLFLSCMLLPTVFVELLIVDSMNNVTVVAVTLYFIGLFAATAQPYKEYISAVISNLQLAKISNTDQLTSLHNRRYFDVKLHEEVQRTVRNQHDLSLMFLDIDYFKKINDEHGHPAGDYCLTCTSNCLSDSIHRISDTIARYGGEEFVIILPNTSADRCLIVAERARQAIENLIITFDEKNIDITISVGCSTITDSTGIKDANPESLIESADKALYEAKQSGRNRVVTRGYNQHTVRK